MTNHYGQPLLSPFQAEPKVLSFALNSIAWWQVCVINKKRMKIPKGSIKREISKMDRYKILPYSYTCKNTRYLGINQDHIFDYSQ